MAISNVPATYDSVTKEVKVDLASAPPDPETTPPAPESPALVRPSVPSDVAGWLETNLREAMKKGFVWRPDVAETQSGVMVPLNRTVTVPIDVSQASAWGASFDFLKLKCNTGVMFRIEIMRADGSRLDGISNQNFVFENLTAIGPSSGKLLWLAVEHNSSWLYNFQLNRLRTEGVDLMRVAGNVFEGEIRDCQHSQAPTTEPFVFTRGVNGGDVTSVRVRGGAWRKSPGYGCILRDVRGVHFFSIDAIECQWQALHAKIGCAIVQDLHAENCAIAPDWSKNPDANRPRAAVLIDSYGTFRDCDFPANRTNQDGSPAPRQQFGIDCFLGAPNQLILDNCKDSPNVPVANVRGQTGTKVCVFPGPGTTVQAASPVVVQRVFT